MSIYFLSVLYWFLLIVRYALIIYVIAGWLPLPLKIKGMMRELMQPLFAPIQLLLSHSVLNIRGIDLSPILLYLIVLYASQLCTDLR